MRSPLPDSSNLEAGIIEDAVPSRLSRVHDNVRDLLRQSVFGVLHSTPTASPTRWSPSTRPSMRILPSPITKSASRGGPGPDSSAEPTPVSLCEEVPGVLFPAWRRQPCDPPAVHGGVAGHLDMSPNAMSVFTNLQQNEAQRHKKRHQHKAWTRPKSRRTRQPNSNTKWVVCIVLGFILLGLLGTYIALATTSAHVSPVLHVLFILALLLTSIVFAHTLVRLSCLSKRNNSKQRIVRIEPAPRRRRHRPHPDEGSAPATSTTVPSHYIPQTPIPVQGSECDDINSTNHGSGPEMYEIAGKGAHILNPPPAYGSMSSSVRADPDLLYWHVIPSPVEGGMPSPTYDQVMRENRVSGHNVGSERQ